VGVYLAVVGFRFTHYATSRRKFVCWLRDTEYGGSRSMEVDDVVALHEGEFLQDLFRNLPLRERLTDFPLSEYVLFPG
jgi:hypothetical protein